AWRGRSGADRLPAAASSPGARHLQAAVRLADRARQLTGEGLVRPSGICACSLAAQFPLRMARARPRLSQDCSITMRDPWPADGGPGKGKAVFMRTLSLSLVCTLALMSPQAAFAEIAPERLDLLKEQA